MRRARSGVCPTDASLEEIRGRVARDEAKFLLIVAADFDERLGMGDTAAHLEVAPGTELPLAMLFEARVRQALTSLYFEQGLGPVLDAGGLNVDAESLTALLAVESLYEGERGRQIPTVRAARGPGMAVVRDVLRRRAVVHHADYGKTKRYAGAAAYDVVAGLAADAGKDAALSGDQSVPGCRDAARGRVPRAVARRRPAHVG